jgi:hypothetical protein
MAGSFRRLSRVIETSLEQLAIPTEDRKLIYHDILCMSWAVVYDRNALSRDEDSRPTTLANRTGVASETT